jgi:hypothetical protein
MLARLATELSYRMKANRCRDFCQSGRPVMESSSQDRQKMMVQDSTCYHFHHRMMFIADGQMKRFTYLTLIPLVPIEMQIDC